jgi:hypothetical protein
MRGVASDASKVIVKSYFNTFFLLHLIALSEPELWILESLLLDLLIFGLNLNH